MPESDVPYRSDMRSFFQRPSLGGPRAAGVRPTGISAPAVKGAKASPARLPADAGPQFPGPARPDRIALDRLQGNASMARITRRRLLKTAGTAGAAAAISAPAIAQSAPSLRWRLATGWPKTLDALFGGSEHFAEYVAEATDNKFQIRCLPADEIAPGLQATDAVSAGTVELCHTAPYYMWNKDPTFALACAVPFSLNGRMQNAWWREGGGERLINAFYEKHGLYGLLAGNTMAQMGGWFRREIDRKSVGEGKRRELG